MAYKQIICKVPEAAVAAANAAYAAITDDDPNAISFTLNSSLSGDAPATHCVNNVTANAAAGSSSVDGTKSEWIDFLDSLAALEGTAAFSYPSTPTVDTIGIAESEWGLFRVA